jgi:threonine/homoserine/homoserine lactone efflux protein
VDLFLAITRGNSVFFESPIASFILTSLVVEMTPGPNMTYLAVLGASRGRIAGFSAVLGVASGLALVGIAVGLGAGSLILDYPLAYETLRWAGALYLCWLAYDSWKEGRQPLDATAADSSAFIHFRRGFVTNILNPKAVLFFIAVVPQFISGAAPSARELATLVSIYVGVATFVHGLIVLLASRLQAFFAAPERREMAGNVFAVVLFLVAAWLFVSGRR